MKRIVCDLDNTITLDASSDDYRTKQSNYELIAKLQEYREHGYEIIIFTARNMATHKGDLGKIEKLTLPIIEEWLEIHSVPYDEIIIGKPWCGDGFYVDDKAIRPQEFISLTEKEIFDLVK